MALKPKGGTQLARRSTKLPPMPLLKSEKFAEARVNKGMVTVIDPLDIEPGALTKAQGVRVRFDKTSRRPGTALFTPSPADANAVLDAIVFKKSNGNLYLIRITPTTIYQLIGSTWTLLTTVTALTGTASNRWITSNVLDKLIGGNGVDVLRNIDPVAGTYEKLSATAPIAKFVTGFFNRAVAAGYANGQAGVTFPGIWIGWSADGDSTKWDPTVDISAGSGPLEDVPYDVSDFITGLYGLTNVLFVAREKSIWLGTKVPIATNPFYFYQAVPGIGCNCPYSLAPIPDGMVWCDTRTKTVWRYSIGGQMHLYRGQIERIGLPIEKDLIAAIQDPNTVFGSYDPNNDEYTVAVPLASSNITRLWTFNFKTKAWSFDELPNITSLNDNDAFTATGMPILALPGLISGLQGTIANLGSGIKLIANTRYLGRSDGTILVEDQTVFTDAGVAYNSDIISKDFAVPETDLYFAQIRIGYFIRRATTVNLYFSKDGGLTWILVKTKTITDSTQLNKPLIFLHNKQHKTRRLRWWFQVTSGDFDIIEYEIRVFPSGVSRK